MPFFNYRVHAIDIDEAGYWARRDFVHAWWSIPGDDSRWTPPPYAWLGAQLDPRRNPHMARMNAVLVHIDALYRTGVRRARTDQQEIPLTSVLEKPLAAAVPLIDPRRKGRTAHLALLHLANDDEAFDRLRDYLVESLSSAGYRRVVGPVGLSPHLGAGVLVDNWHEWPPAHTPSNSPYLPEILERRFRPFQISRLFTIDVPREAPAPRDATAAIRALDPARLAGDLLPLLAEATDNTVAAFPAPDEIEAAYLLRTLESRTLTGYLAEINGEPAGFALMGADIAGRLRAARGGRPMWGRAWLGLAADRRTHAGRVYFAVVRREDRRKGIGRQLWQACLGEAAARGWTRLSIGPVWSPGAGEWPAELFLNHMGAAAHQTYQLYEWSF